MAKAKKKPSRPKKARAKRKHTLVLTDDEFDTVVWCLNQMRKESLDEPCRKCGARGSQVLKRNESLKIVKCTACPRQDEHH